MVGSSVAVSREVPTPMGWAPPARIRRAGRSHADADLSTCHCAAWRAFAHASAPSRWIDGLTIVSMDALPLQVRTHIQDDVNDNDEPERSDDTTDPSGSRGNRTIHDEWCTRTYGRHSKEPSDPIWRVSDVARTHDALTSTWRDRTDDLLTFSMPGCGRCPSRRTR